MTFPCKECIVLAICIRTPQHQHLFTMLMQMTTKCQLLLEYLRLDDLPVIFPPVNATQKQKDEFNKYQRPRIIRLSKYMNWDYDLHKWLKKDKK